MLLLQNPEPIYDHVLEDLKLVIKWFCLDVLSINDSLKDLFLVKQLECVQVFHMNWHAIVY